MKLQTNACLAKLPSLEEGAITYNTLDESSMYNCDRGSDVYTRCMRLIKVVLYIELVLFLGWAGCIFLTNYYQDRRYNSTRVPYDQSEGTQPPIIQDDHQPITDIQGLLALPLGEYILSAANYEDEPTDAERSSVLDDRNADMRFDFELPAERHFSREARMIDAQKNDSSGSSSEETKDQAMRMKRSADSSSSESDSSDSSSSEKDPSTAEASKEGHDCPAIIDEDGNAVDDPKEIASYIKRNWLNSLLKTTIPDCDEPKSTKTVSVDECGRFVVKCDLDESNEDDDNGRRSLKNKRNMRDAK